MNKETLEYLIPKIHKVNTDNGWFANEYTETKLRMLICSEVLEVFEAERDNKYYEQGEFAHVGDFFKHYKNEHKDYYKTEFEFQVKGCFEVEIADIIIRCLDWLFYQDNFNVNNLTLTEISPSISGYVLLDQMNVILYRNDTIFNRVKGVLELAL